MDKEIMKKAANSALRTLEGLDASNIKAISILFTDTKNKKSESEEPENEMEDEMEGGEEEGSEEECPECGGKMEEGECEDCGYEEKKPNKEMNQMKQMKGK